MSVFALAVLAAAVPSFDCTRAAHPVERLICADPALAARDRAVALLYRSRLARDPAKRRRQSEWLLQTRNACSDAACVREALDDRIADILAEAGAMPATSLRHAPNNGRMEIMPVGDGWFLFRITAAWFYQGGDNANTGEAGGVFKLNAGRGHFATGYGCALDFTQRPGGWDVKEQGHACGGLNVTLTGMYRSR